MAEDSEPPESPGSSDSDEPLGDLTRRIRERRSARAAEGRSETDAPGAEDARKSEEVEQDTGFDFDADTDETGIDADLDGIDSDTDTDADVDSDELFEEMDVSDIDTDEVWDSVLADEDTDDPIENATPTVDVDSTGAVKSTVGADHIVPKDDYCESCHFFSAPPTVECSYEGSEIIEIVDSEQFRVRNCPVVAGSVDTYGEVVGRDDE